MGNIPKSKGKEEILDEFGKLTGKVLEQTKIFGTLFVKGVGLQILGNKRTYIPLSK